MCKRNIDWLFFAHPQLKTWPTIQTCALAGNWTGDPLVCRLTFNPLSHTSQGIIFNSYTIDSLMLLSSKFSDNKIILNYIFYYYFFSSHVYILNSTETGPGLGFTWIKALAMLGSLLKQYLPSFCHEGLWQNRTESITDWCFLQHSLFNKSTPCMLKWHGKVGMLYTVLKIILNF